MILDAVSEWHPLNLIQDTLEDSYYFSGLKDSIDYMFQFGNSDFLVQAYFWENLHSFVRKSTFEIFNAEEVIGQMYEIKYERADFEKILQNAHDRIEIARSIFEQEAYALEKYGNVYAEGHIAPLGRFASNIGKRVVFLDHQNPFYNKVKSEESYFWQEKREGVWAGRIISTNSSIIVAGNAHINNEYGLQDMLEARGIELKIVKEFDN